MHYPQVDVIASYGTQLLDWLNRLHLPGRAGVCRARACGCGSGILSRPLAGERTTTAAVFCTVHPQSVDAFFTASEARGLGMIAGKCLMDRRAGWPDRHRRHRLSRQQGADRAVARLARSRYAITPRFAPTSTLPQMQAMGQLARSTLMSVQSHVAENRAEIAWVNGAVPRPSQLSGCVRPLRPAARPLYLRTASHLDDADRARMTAAGATIVLPNVEPVHRQRPLQPAAGARGGQMR